MNSATTEAMAWALVHFLWQGAAIALAAGAAELALRRARPQARYALHCGALAVMALAPAITFAMSLAPPLVRSAAPVAASAARATAALAVASTAPARPEWLGWLVGIWLCGVAILSIRALCGWALAQRLTRLRTSPAADRLTRAASHLRSVLGIRRAVLILNSAAAEVPATIGWLRPVVLLPVGALVALTPEQLELLLAHELAHIRRHDYLVNLVQTAVETVLFYHPAVWWVSGRIRAEREHCCDDLAVATCGDAVAYAKTLASLEGLRTWRPALAVAADGGSLLARIRRLSNREPKRGAAPPAWIGALIPAALVVAAVLTAAPRPAVAESAGYLHGLAEAGYAKVSVDEIIALKEHGVEPRYIKDMLSAGLGALSVEPMIQLRIHGVEPEFVAGVVSSGLVSNLDVPSVIRLNENRVSRDDLSRIRALGFGPYTSDEVVRLRQNGVDATTFETLIEARIPHAGVEDAILIRQNGITTDRIRSMKKQGFDNLTLEQIVKLSRGGII